MCCRFRGGAREEVMRDKVRVYLQVLGENVYRVHRVHRAGDSAKDREKAPQLSFHSLLISYTNPARLANWVQTRALGGGALGIGEQPAERGRGKRSASVEGGGRGALRIWDGVTVGKRVRIDGGGEGGGKRRNGFG